MTYYNDHDHHACQWMRNLMAAGLISKGVVDDRDIKSIRASELAGHERCHFFAGIAGWDYALRLAGFPEDCEVWTGSCPCQSFSAAGRRQGHADPRGGLWQDFFRLIRECRPATVIGEQVGGAIAFGWLDGIFDDLEDAGYACGAAVLPACSVGAPCIGARLFWVATSESPRRCRGGALEKRRQEKPRGPSASVRPFAWPDGSGSKSTLTVPEVLQASHGVPGRVGLLRGYGNAINPHLAAEFIRAVMECE